MLQLPTSSFLAAAIPTLAVLLSSAVGVPTIAHEQLTPRPCPLPESAATASSAYRRRGDRCEGEYARQFRQNVNLRIVGIHATAPEFDTTSPSVRLRVEAGRPNERVLLKATSTKSRHFYRMDTEAVSPAWTYEWPLNVVAAVKLLSTDVAVLACARNCDEGRPRWPTLLPVGFAGARTLVEPVAVIVADVPLTSVKSTLVVAGSAQFAEREELKWTLAAGTPLRVQLGNLRAVEATLSLSAMTSDDRQDYVEAVVRLP